MFPNYSLLLGYQVILVGFSLIYNTSARHERHECDQVGNEQHERDTSVTRVLHEQPECDTRVKKISILITTQVKTYFHIPILTIYQVKYKEWNNFILSTAFGNASFPCV